MKDPTEQREDFRHRSRFTRMASKVAAIALLAQILSLAAVSSVGASVPAIAPPNPSDACSWNWNFWETDMVTEPEDENLLDPRRNGIVVLADNDLGVGSWWDLSSSAPAPTASQTNVADGVAANETTSDTQEIFYGVGNFVMVPGSSTTFTVTDSAFWEGHSWAMFDSAGTQIGRFPDTANGLYYASTNQQVSSTVPFGGIDRPRNFSETFTFTAPADGQVFLHYLLIDDGARATTAVTDLCITPSPSIELTKSLSPAGQVMTAVDQVLTFDFVVENTGNVSLTPTVTDPLLDAPPVCPATNNPVDNTLLDPGETITCTGSYTVTQADLDAGEFLNTATVEGAPIDAWADQGVASVMDTDDETTPADVQASLDIVKMSDITEFTAVGDPIIFTFEVTNDGDVTLDPVTVSDPTAGPVTCSPTALAPTEVATCTADNPYLVTQADLDAGSLTNTATAEGTPPAGSGLPPATADDTVIVGGTPELGDDISTGNAPGSTVTFDILGNDPSIDIDPNSVMLIDPATGLPVSGPLVIPGEGTWSFNPVTDEITFVPEPGFMGDPTPLDYVASDTDGNPAEPATITIDYLPVAEPDQSLGNPEGSPVTIDPFANDPSNDLDPNTVALDDPNYDPATATLVVPGEGTWTVDPVTGEITFTPEPGFLGDPTPVGYTVMDDDGNTTEPVDVTITYAPELEDDSSLDNLPGTAVTLDILGNDPSIDIDLNSVMLIDPATGLPVSGPLVIPGEGTWTFDPATGEMTFTPEPGFVGDPTPIEYVASDFDGNEAEPAEVVVTYRDPEPVPSDENLNNVAGTAVTVDILANDGDVDPTSVQLVDPSTGLPIAGDLVVPGEGTWTVDPVSGALTFTPEDSFDGDPTPVDYVVTNVLSEVVTATATITYADPVTTPSAPVLAFTGVESYQLALLALLALGAGFGMLRFRNTLLSVRKDDE